MKWLTAGLTLVNGATVCALFLGIVFGGLSRSIALLSFLLGLTLALFAWWQTSSDREEKTKPTTNRGASLTSARMCFWLLAGCFAFFAFRSFGWLLFIDGNQLKVQSPNNLGDLALHIAYVKNFASGVPLWPDNPIHAFSKMRYPAGTDLFNALLLLLGCDLTRGFIWVGLIGSLATFFALHKWGGSFTVAGFLFNGGLAGFKILQTGKFLDYQGDKTIAWKSLPLAMLVTQRGLLYALPAGLLLLYHWRAKYFRASDSSLPNETKRGTGPLPFWVELSLYATMPLFHLHTFMALSLVAAFLFLIGDGATRKRLALLVAAAVLPATFFVWTITDHFRASSLLHWQPGWVQHKGDFAMPFFTFWIWNFGVLGPLVLALLGVIACRAWQTIPRISSGRISAALQFCRTSTAFAFLAPATLLFLFAYCVKTAPWEWDNIKLIIWAYLIMLPFLWQELIARWPLELRAGICVALFASGFVSLFGALTKDPNGYALAERGEVDGVGYALRNLPVTARFAAFPTYNHPLLLQGRRVVLGYPGHLWTQGFDYSDAEKRLTKLMLGAPDWREQARYLGARYLFWGREEKNNYAISARPWEREARSVASGNWGAIFDLESAPAAPVR